MTRRNWLEDLTTTWKCGQDARAPGRSQTGDEFMTESILPPKSNTVFQLLFGDQRNVELLADFLQSVLDIP